MDAKKFHRKIGKNQVMVKETPPKDSIEKLWKGIWGEKKACNMSASWIGNMEKGNEKLKKQECENITVLELKAALTKSQKWISPGIDKVPNFWLNALSSSHVTLTSLMIYSTLWIRFKHTFFEPRDSHVCLLLIFSISSSICSILYL